MGLEWDSTSAVHSGKKIYSGRTEVLYSHSVDLGVPMALIRIKACFNKTEMNVCLGSATRQFVNH